MLRLIHNHTTTSPILVDDIDDGMPNKEVYRLGSTADPKAYQRDGYANDPKQPCYIPYSKPTDPTIQGYIDLNQTERVSLSAGKGKIKKLSDAGFVTVLSFVKSDVAAPTVTNGQTGVPGAGDLTITGTNFLSLAPNTSTVVLTGAGAVSLTSTAILTGGGTFTNTSIVIPAALVPGIGANVTSVKVKADDLFSNTFVLV